MNEYITIHQTNNNLTPNPNNIIAIIHHTNNTITIHGTQEFINTWTPYLASPNFTKNHGTNQPLKSFTSRLSMYPTQHHTTGYNTTLKKLNNPKTTTIKQNTQIQPKPTPTQK